MNAETSTLKKKKKKKEHQSVLPVLSGGGIWFGFLVKWQSWPFVYLHLYSWGSAIILCVPAMSTFYTYDITLISLLLALCYRFTVTVSSYPPCVNVLVQTMALKYWFFGFEQSIVFVLFYFSALFYYLMQLLHTGTRSDWNRCMAPIFCSVCIVLNTRTLFRSGSSLKWCTCPIVFNGNTSMTSWKNNVIDTS